MRVFALLRRPGLRRGLLLALAAGAAAFSALAPRPAFAETKTVRLAKQFGISYLPLTIIEKKGLLEAEGKKLGLDLKTEWLQFTGGAPMNEALIFRARSTSSPAASARMLVIWGKTRGNLGVKGVAALNSMPLYLNTTDANVKSIKDFSAKDKIGAAHRQGLDPGDHLADGGREGVSAKARPMRSTPYRLDGPSGRASRDDERQIRGRCAFRLRAVSIRRVEGRARPQGARQLRGAGRPPYLQRHLDDNAVTTTRTRW